MSQTEQIFEALKKGPLTALDAQKHYGCMRLAARVKDLKDAGYEIHDRWVTVANRFGDAVRVKAYWA